MASNNATKQKILDTAYALFQCKGFHAVGLNEIISLSGAPKGSLYYYFPNGKEELACAAIQQAYEHIAADIRDAMDSSPDVVEAFSNHVEAMREHLGDDGGHFSLTLLALETAHDESPLHDICASAIRDTIALYEQRLEKAGYRGQEAHETAEVIRNIIDGSITLALVTGDDGSIDTAQNQIVKILKRKDNS